MLRFRINDDMTSWSEERFQKELALVSDQRREKVLRIKHQPGRQQSLMAYRLLQELLNEVYGITESPVFRELENGKPVIIGHEDIHFNLSHCKYGVACAVSDAPVGIDIERIPEKCNEELAAYVLNAQELETMRASDSPTLQFTRFWTMKEAMVKLTGRGLTGKEQLQPLLNEWHEGKGDVEFECIENEKYVCNVVLEKTLSDSPEGERKKMS